MDATCWSILEPENPDFDACFAHPLCSALFECEFANQGDDGPPACILECIMSLPMTDDMPDEICYCDASTCSPDETLDIVENIGQFCCNSFGPMDGATVPRDVCESLVPCDTSDPAGPYPCIGDPLYVPPCVPGCPGHWLGDGHCDEACMNEECDFDRDDCDGGYGYGGDDHCDVVVSYGYGDDDLTSSPSGTTNHGPVMGWCKSELDYRVGCTVSPADCWAMCLDKLPSLHQGGDQGGGFAYGYSDDPESPEDPGAVLVAIDWNSWDGSCYCQSDCECMNTNPGSYYYYYYYNPSYGYGGDDPGYGYGGDDPGYGFGHPNLDTYVITADSAVDALPHECVDLACTSLFAGGVTVEKSVNEYSVDFARSIVYAAPCTAKHFLYVFPNLMDRQNSDWNHPTLRAFTSRSTTDDPVFEDPMWDDESKRPYYSSVCLSGEGGVLYFPWNAGKITYGRLDFKLQSATSWLTFSSHQMDNYLSLTTFTVADVEEERAFSGCVNAGGKIVGIPADARSVYILEDTTTYENMPTFSVSRRCAKCPSGSEKDKWAAGGAGAADRYAFALPRLCAALLVVDTLAKTAWTVAAPEYEFTVPYSTGALVRDGHGNVYGQAGKALLKITAALLPSVGSGCSAICGSSYCYGPMENPWDIVYACMDCQGYFSPCTASCELASQRTWYS